MKIQMIKGTLGGAALKKSMIKLLWDGKEINGNKKRKENGSGKAQRGNRPSFKGGDIDTAIVMGGGG